MDRALYIASGGGKEIMRAQTVNANNLANANTVGFKKDLAVAQSLPLYGPGNPSRVYDLEEGFGADLSPGSLMTTGRDMDVAVSGDGWIAVSANNGDEAYTRAGDLRVTPSGLLTNGAGHPVLGNSGTPITLPPSEKVEIGVDGTITVRPQGQDATTLVVVDRIKLVNPTGSALEKGEDGLMRSKDQAVLAPDASVRLASGMLEGSNVNMIESMINMVELARKYEMQVKVMDTAGKNDSASTQLMNIG